MSHEYFQLLFTCGTFKSEKISKSATLKNEFYCNWLQNRQNHSLMDNIQTKKKIEISPAGSSENKINMLEVSFKAANQNWWIIISL